MKENAKRSVRRKGKRIKNMNYEKRKEIGMDRKIEMKVFGLVKFANNE